jgi:hypothetical protein
MADLLYRYFRWLRLYQWFGVLLAAAVLPFYPGLTWGVPGVLWAVGTAVWEAGVVWSYRRGRVWWFGRRYL